MKLVVLNQATRHHEFRKADAAVKMTWIDSVTNPNAKVYSYYGNQYLPRNYYPNFTPPENGCMEHEGDLTCDCLDGTWYDGKDARSYKMLMAMKWVLENEEFDFILRTGVPCYYDIDRLYDEIAKLPRENVYGGQAHRINQDPFKFTAGFMTVFSRDIVEKLVADIEHLSEVEHQVEDIAIGNFITNVRGYIGMDDITPFIHYKCFRELNHKGVDKATGENDIPEEDKYIYRFSFYHPKRILAFHKRYQEFRNEV